MKKIIQLSLLFLLISCTQEVKENPGTETTSVQEEKAYKSAHQMIYANTACLDSTDRTFARLVLSSDTVSDQKPLKGKIFFSSGYLRSLAVCNGIDYKIGFKVNNFSKNIFDYYSESSSDTIYFSIPSDSIKLSDSNKSIDKYELKCSLRASYFKENEVMGYDTIMPVKKTVYIDRR